MQIKKQKKLNLKKETKRGGGGMGNNGVFFSSSFFLCINLVPRCEHKGPVTALVMSRTDKECISASHDGSCITWDMARFVRNTCFFASTQFAAVCLSCFVVMCLCFPRVVNPIYFSVRLSVCLSVCLSMSLSF